MVGVEDVVIIGVRGWLGVVGWVLRVGVVVLVWGVV